MSNTLKIKRRQYSSGTGAPSTLASGELAFSEFDQILYIGRDGQSLVEIGGSGKFVTLGSSQTISGAKVLSGTISATGGVTVDGQPLTVKGASLSVKNSSNIEKASISDAGAIVAVSATLSGAASCDTLTATTSSSLAAASASSITVSGSSNVAGLNVSGNAVFSGTLSIEEPTQSAHAASKGYVDTAFSAAAQGLDVKASVRAATTANITLSGTQTIDGISVVAGDRVLVKAQSTQSQNGIYVVSASSWERAADFDASNKVTAGAFTFVEEGTANADSGWVLTTDGAITLGTTELAFVQFSGAGQITAGDGMTKSGNTLNVVGTAGRIVANSDAIDLATVSNSPGSAASDYHAVQVDGYGRVTGASRLTFGDGVQLADRAVSAKVVTGQLAIASGEIGLATTAVTAGTYGNVTVDAYGRVTAISAEIDGGTF